MRCLQAEMVISAAEELQHLKTEVQDQTALNNKALAELHGLEMALTDANAANLELDAHHRCETCSRTFLYCRHN